MATGLVGSPKVDYALRVLSMQPHLAMRAFRENDLPGVAGCRDDAMSVVTSHAERRLRHGNGCIDCGRVIDVRVVVMMMEAVVSAMLRFWLCLAWSSSINKPCPLLTRMCWRMPHSDHSDYYC